MIGIIMAFRKFNKTHWRIGLALLDTIKKHHIRIYTQVDLLIIVEK